MSYALHPLEKEVFRAYDIRGLVDTQLNENAMYTLGWIIGLTLTSLHRKNVFVARDGRLSSEAFAQAIQTGLIEAGVQVIDLGVVSTPMMYFATHTHACDSGLMITGSHNPANYNGLKMILAGKTLMQTEIEKLYQDMLALLAAPLPPRLGGSLETLNIEPAYTARLQQNLVLKRPLKVVIDCGNGMAGPFAPAVLAALGCEVIPLYCEVDGRFPNHHPDPTIEANLVDLREQVLLHQADIGLGFDGDADRLGVITNQGDIIWPDRLMMFYAQDILARHPNATIVFDVKCSKALKQHIEKLGGTPLMCPTGHSIVKNKMKEVNSPLAGEMSGHLFFKDQWYGFDDALYSACRLLALLSQQPTTMSEQFSTIPNLLSTPELKIPIAESQKFDFMKQFSEQATFEHADRITIDGLRVEFEEGWGLVRASNTTPCLVARFEANNASALQRIQAAFKTELLQLSASLDVPF